MGGVGGPSCISSLVVCLLSLPMSWSYEEPQRLLELTRSPRADEETYSSAYPVVVVRVIRTYKIVERCLAKHRDIDTIL